MKEPYGETAQNSTSNSTGGMEPTRAGAWTGKTGVWGRGQSRGSAATGQG